MLGPLGSNSEGAGASREGLPTHTQQSRGAGLLQLSIQVPGQSGGAKPPCHPACEGVTFILLKCPLSPGVTINLWCQFPPTWNTVGGFWGELREDRYCSETGMRSSYRGALG